MPAATKVGALVTEAKKISNADRVKAEALLAEIARRKSHIGQDFYDIGIALAQIVKHEYHRALGYASFDELLEKRDVMSPTSARGLIRLVTTVTRDEALEYGQEKVLALLSYAKTTPEVDTPKTLMEGGKLPDGKPVADASVRDIRNAAKRSRTTQGKTPSLSPEAKTAQAEAKALTKWLHAHGAAKARVTTIRAKGGVYALRIDLTISASAALRTR